MMILLGDCTETAAENLPAAEYPANREEEIRRLESGEERRFWRTVQIVRSAIEEREDQIRQLQEQSEEDRSSRRQGLDEKARQLIRGQKETMLGRTENLSLHSGKNFHRL